VTLEATVTSSHSPLMGRNQPAGEIVAAVDAAFDRARDFVRTMDPDVVVVLAPDHYNGMFYRLMPPFCVGMAARSVGDYGTAAGALEVHREVAAALTEGALAADVDVAVSEQMVVDHGFAQPLELLFGAIDAVPVVPVFVNSVAVPLGPVRRARLLGEAIGRVLADRPERALVLGSGGLSHDPPLPDLESAPSAVAEALITGADTGPDARQAREERVLLASRSMAAGTSSRRDLNPEWDRAFMSVLRDGRLREVDGWTNEHFVKEAGSSSHEVRTWLAAYAALSVAGPYVVQDEFYEPIPEWVAGFGITTARLA